LNQIATKCKQKSYVFRVKKSSPRHSHFTCSAPVASTSALRLRRGQSIGSGLVEGTIKQMVNLRMKQTGVRWRLEHVGPFVELRALAAGPE